MLSTSLAGTNIKLTDIITHLRGFEGLCQIEVTRAAVPRLIDKLKMNKPLGPEGIYTKSLKELNCDIADLLTKICRVTKIDLLNEHIEINQHSADF